MAKPYTKRWIYNLLLENIPDEISKNKPSRRYLHKTADTARKAYLIGVSEARKGKKPDIFKDMPVGSSDLENLAWKFVFICYLQGHNRKG